MGIKHTFVSSEPDGTDTSVVRPSDWNHDHTIDGDVDLNGHALLQPKLGGNLNPNGFGSSATWSPSVASAYDLGSDALPWNVIHGNILKTPLFFRLDNTIANNGPGLQSAINTATAYNLALIIYGQGTFTSGVSITDRISISGLGAVLTTSFNGTLFTIDTTKAVRLDNLRIFNSNFATFNNTTYISVTSPPNTVDETGQYLTSENERSFFTRLFLVNAQTAIRFVLASVWTVDQCWIRFAGAGASGIVVASTGDSGDSTICNTQIWGPNTSSADSTRAIFHTSGGGLRVENCKFLGINYGYFLKMDPGVQTEGLQIIGCNMDAYEAIHLERGTDPTATYRDIVFSGNRLGSRTFVIFIGNDPSGRWATGVLIGNNIIRGGDVSGPLISIDSVSGLLIAENILFPQAVGTFRIGTGGALDNALLGPNLAGAAGAGNAINGTNITQIAPV